MTFRILAPMAKDVRLASDLFGWDRAKKMRKEGDYWVIRTDLPTDARLEYQFVVDGKWMLDPTHHNVTETGVGTLNSVFIGQDYEPVEDIPLPEIPMRRISMMVGQGHLRRNVVVYRPEDQSKDLPVLIYGDGKEYDANVSPQHICQNLIDQGKIPPVAIALVPPKDRIAEYWKNSDDYENFLVHSLLPDLRRRAGVSENPADVFVGGASLGGLIALRLLEKHPLSIAGGVHSQSGAFWAAPGVMAKAALTKIPDSARLYLDWGRFEGVLTVSNDRLVEALERIHKPYGSELTSEGHNWTAWKRRYAKGVEYLLGDRIKDGK